MAKIKRNAPCPCGSGRKQKLCCGKPTVGNEFTRERNLRCEIQLNKNAFRWATRKLGDRALEDAWDEFLLGLLDIPLHEMEDRAPFSALFFPWWLYGGCARETDSGSPIMLYLDSRRSAEDSLERQIAAAIEAAPFSFHRVVEVDPGQSMTLEELFTGEVHTVLERAGSVEQARSAYLYARVATVDGVAGLFGNGPFLVEPSCFPELKALRDGLEAGVGGKLTKSMLHEFAAEIRTRYLSIAASILDPAPPTLVNTEGDSMVPTLLVYELGCDCEHAFDKLKTLAKGHKPATLLEGAELDDAGRLAHVSLPWIESRKPGMPGEGPLILGYLLIETGRLEIEVNSVERAERIRKRISRRLGSKARFVRAVHESVEEMWRDRVESGADTPTEEPGPEADSPELQQAIARRMQQHWASWFDASIPALQGLTPRQAAKTEEGRELLEALLADYERKSRKQPGSPTNPDIAELRRELGLK